MPINLYTDVHQAFSFSDAPQLSLQPARKDEQKGMLLKIIQTVEGNPLVLELLETLKARIGEHYYHSLRVGAMFRELTLREKELGLNLSSYTLEVAGLLHDYGKTKIPQVVLHKQGKLLPSEQEVMHTHNRLAVASPEIRHLDHNFYPHLCAIIVAHHPYPRKENARRYHERRHLLLLTGGGERSGERRRYERRTTNPPVLRVGMLLALADQYDALSSGREYKSPLPVEEVRKELEQNFPGEKIEDLINGYSVRF
ncbi:MAG: HD domain-containing protein [Nanoarchaeota archaeon]